MPCSYAWITKLACQWRDTVYTRSKNKNKKETLCILRRGRQWETLLQMWEVFHFYINAHNTLRTSWEYIIKKKLVCTMVCAGLVRNGVILDECEAWLYCPHSPFGLFLPLCLALPWFSTDNPPPPSVLSGVMVTDPSGTAYPGHSGAALWIISLCGAKTWRREREWKDFYFHFPLFSKQ